MTHRFIEVLSKRIYENTPVICSLLFKMKALACSFCALRWQRPETDESLLRLLTSAQQPRVSWVLLWKEILERSGRICFLFLQWIMGSYSISLGQGVSSWWWLLFLPFNPLHFPACVLFLVKLQHFPPNILQLNDIQLILSHISWNSKIFQVKAVSFQTLTKQLNLSGSGFCCCCCFVWLSVFHL